MVRHRKNSSPFLSQVGNFYFSHRVEILFSVLFFILFTWLAYFTVVTRGQFCYGIFKGAAEDLVSGLDPYVFREGRPSPYKYPLIATYFFIPTLWISNFLGQVLWNLLNSFFWILGALIFWSFLNRSRDLTLGFQKGERKFFFFSLILSLSGFLANGFYGQINSILFGMVMLSLFFSERNQFKLSGFWMSGAVLLKLFPLGYLFPYLVEKKYRISLLTLLGVGVFLALPVLHLGWDQYREWNLTLIQRIQEDFKAPLLKTSLWAMLLNYFADHPVKIHNGWDVVHLQWFSISVLKWIYRGFFLFFSGIVLYGSFLIWKGQDNRRGLLWGLLFVLSLLFSHMSETPTFVLMTPALMALVHEWRKEGKILETSAILFSFLIFVVFSTNVVGGALRDLLMVYSIKTWGALGVAGFLSYFLVRK